MDDEAVARARSRSSCARSSAVPDRRGQDPSAGDLGPRGRLLAGRPPAAVGPHRSLAQGRAVRRLGRQARRRGLDGRLRRGGARSPGLSPAPAARGRAAVGPHRHADQEEPAVRRARGRRCAAERTPGLPRDGPAANAGGCDEPGLEEAGPAGPDRAVRPARRPGRRARRETSSATGPSIPSAARPGTCRISTSSTSSSGASGGPGSRSSRPRDSTRKWTSATARPCPSAWRPCREVLEFRSGRRIEPRTSWPGSTGASRRGSGSRARRQSPPGTPSLAKVTEDARLFARPATRPAVAPEAPARGRRRPLPGGPRRRARRTAAGGRRLVRRPARSGQGPGAGMVLAMPPGTRQKPARPQDVVRRRLRRSEGPVYLEEPPAAD